MNRRSCKGCFYHRLIHYPNKRARCCHYALIKGELRGCPADKCDKKLVVDKETDRRMFKEYLSKTLYNIAKGVSKNER